MKPAELNLTSTRAVVQGSPYHLSFDLSGEYLAAVDLDDWTFAAQIRTGYGQGSPAFAESPPDPVATFDVEISDAVVGAATVALSLDADTTAALDHRREYVWDVVAIDEANDDLPLMLMRGRLKVTAQVTLVVEGP